MKLPNVATGALADNYIANRSQEKGKHVAPTGDGTVIHVGHYFSDCPDDICKAWRAARRT